MAPKKTNTKMIVEIRKMNFATSLIKIFPLMARLQVVQLALALADEGFSFLS